MNLVVITGRLTRDPVVSYGASNQKAVARFNLAVDRPKGEDGKSSADFPSVVCFGKTAEMVEKYVRKGKKIGVQGRILTGKYDKDGSTVYTTDIVADRIEFLESKKDENGNPEPAQGKPVQGTVPEGFQALDDDIPFGGM